MSECLMRRIKPFALSRMKTQGFRTGCSCFLPPLKDDWWDLNGAGEGGGLEPPATEQASDVFHHVVERWA